MPLSDDRVPDDRRTPEERPPSAPGPAGRAFNPLLSAPILPTLLRLSLPNIAGMAATALVAVAETAYAGVLGTAPLAAMALVFPMVMLQQMTSAGAMGGGISSAISRALGSGDEARARALAVHATLIGACAGLLFTTFFLGLGPSIYRLLGGQGPALQQATAYSNVVFTGAVAVWLANTLASVVRGGGNMKVPSAALLAIAVIQVMVGGGLGLGIGPLPRLGLVGIALGQVIAYAVGALFLLWFLWSGRARVPLVFEQFRPRRELFADILKVGALACLSSLQTVLTVLILTRLVARFGTEALAGYGIGTRLEFLLIPITFAIGVACVPLVGMAMGAGDIPRARRVAWTAGALAALVIGIAGLVVAAFPDLWVGLFSSDQTVLASGRTYLRWAGPAFGFFGLGLCLYFAAQGSGKVLGPVLAGTLRLVLVAVGGSMLAIFAAPPWALFALVGVSMVAYGLAAAAAIYWTAWGGHSLPAR
jgi:putative MATE family efflux protein